MTKIPDARAAAAVALTDPKAARREAVEAAVTAWVNLHLRDSPVSQHTPAWNHVQASLPALIGAVVTSLEGA